MTLFGPLATKSSNRAARLRLGPDGSSLGCQYADRTVQLWSIQSEAQLKRQLKRRQEKGKRKRKDGGDVEEEVSLGRVLALALALALALTPTLTLALALALTLTLTLTLTPTLDAGAPRANGAQPVHPWSPPAERQRRR